MNEDWGALLDSLMTPGSTGLDSGTGFDSGVFNDPNLPQNTVYFDNLKQQYVTLDQIMADPQLSADFQSQQEGLSAGGTPTGSSSSGLPVNPGNPQAPKLPFFDPNNPDFARNMLALGGIGLPALLGLGGVAQGLMQGGATGTVVNKPNQSPAANAAQQAALQGLLGGQQYAFGQGAGTGTGLAGQLQGMAPGQQGASQTSLQGLLAQLQGNPFLAQAQGQAFDPTYTQWAQTNAANVGHAPNDLANPDLQRIYNTMTGNSPSMTATNLGNPLLQQFSGQIQGYGSAQSNMLNAGALGALGLQNPAAGALGQNAQGMAQGQLPALSPALRAQVAATFEPQRQDIARYTDQAMQAAIERSRQQGFAGGNEIFREGTPSALFAPSLAEATRQQGSLAGQQAAAELALAQSLPQQGGNIANQLYQQQLAQNQAVQGAAGGYTTPLSVSLQGGLGLSGLNQNVMQALGNYGQQGMTNQLDFLRSLGGMSYGGASVANSAQQGAGSIQTQQQPFNLLSAFAPTASLLGGIGGAMTGFGAMTGNPATYQTGLGGRSTNPAFANGSL